LAVFEIRLSLISLKGGRQMSPAAQPVPCGEIGTGRLDFCEHSIVQFPGTTGTSPQIAFWFEVVFPNAVAIYRLRKRGLFFENGPEFRHFG
jgi:hypothetical protein